MDITTISGKFLVEMNAFASKKSDRDENMHEALESTKYKDAIFSIIGLMRSCFAIDKNLKDIKGKIEDNIRK